MADPIDLDHVRTVAGRYRMRGQGLRAAAVKGSDRLRAANEEVLAGMLEGLATEITLLREAAHVGIELDNHHNAWLCPYCTTGTASQAVGIEDANA